MEAKTADTIISWKDAASDFRGFQLMKLVPSMANSEGYVQLLSDVKKGISANVLFDRNYVLDRFSSMLTDLNLFKSDEIEILLDDILDYHLQNAVDKQSDEISALLAKYGKDVIEAALKR